MSHRVFRAVLAAAAGLAAAVVFATPANATPASADDYVCAYEPAVGGYVCWTEETEDEDDDFLDFEFLSEDFLDVGIL